MATESTVNLPIGYFSEFTTGRPLFNGNIYIGEADQDPILNPILIQAIQEDGSRVTIPQPVKISAGGRPEYNGSPVQIVASQTPYSLLVQDRNNQQEYFFPVTDGERVLSSVEVIKFMPPTVAGQIVINVPARPNSLNTIINGVLLQETDEDYTYNAATGNITLASPLVDTDDVEIQYGNIVSQSAIILGEGALIFNTLSDVQSSTELSIGDWVETKGFSVAGDGGAATYLITDNTPNNVTVYACQNNLSAELQRTDDGNYNVKSLGLIDDGATFNDARLIEILTIITDAVLLWPESNITYLFGDTITIPKESRITFQGVKANRGFPPSGSQIDFDFTANPKVGLDRIGIKIGVADGNPDVTGFAFDFYMDKMVVTTLNQTAHVAVDITNTAFFQLTDNVITQGWRERVINSNGGNIIGKVINNELFGRSNNDVGIYAIYHGDYQFGNFDVRYYDNHISGCNYIAKVGEGRDFRFCHNTVDGAGTAGFDLSGLRAVNIWIDDNYFEAVRGTFLDQSLGSPQNIIYNLSFDNNEIWGNQFTGPTFGNISRINNYTQDNSFIPTVAIRDQDPSLGLSGVYDDANPFDTSRTVRYQSENYNYETSLTEGLLTGELTQAAGLFGEIDGIGNLARPLGWIRGDAGTWTIEDTQIGRCARFDNSGSFIICEKVINFTPIINDVAPRVQIIYSARGWLACEIVPDGGTAIPTFDQSTNGEFDTLFATVVLPINTTQFTIRLLTNQVTVDLAEFKIWQVSGFDALLNNGRLAEALQRSCVKNLIRGYYGEQIQ